MGIRNTPEMGVSVHALSLSLTARALRRRPRNNFLAPSKHYFFPTERYVPPRPWQQQ